MQKIFEIATITELHEYLSGIPNVDDFREQLHIEFLKYSQYSDAREWNVAVRICEALAIIGWGTHEPVEAVRGTYFNGNPETYFINRYAKPRFFNAVWSRHKDGFAIDYGLSFLHGCHDNPLVKPIRVNQQIGNVLNIPLLSQRNWIPKNPIRIIRGIANCYESSQQLIDSIEKELMPKLDRGMRPELYGTAIDTIILNLSFSFFDNDHCKTNYIIADESMKLKKKDFYPKLLEMYSENEIEENGYYLRNRFTYGPFRSDTGSTRVTIVFEKEFSELPICGQKRRLSEYLVQAVEHVAKRLDGKLDYDFLMMIEDFKSILSSWLKND